MSTIRILFITSGLGIGGAEVMLCQLLSRLDRSQFQPVVFSLRKKAGLGKQITDLGIPVINFDIDKLSPLGLIGFYGLIKTVIRMKPDLIQGWMYHGNIAAQISNLLLFPRAAVLISIHSSIYSLKYFKKTTSMIIKLSGWLSNLSCTKIFVSQLSKCQHENVGYSSKNTFVIPNGVDTSKFKPDLYIRREIRDELEILPEEILIGMIARFDPQKDHNNFFHAARLLCDRYDNVRFLLCGTGVDTKNNFLNKLISGFGISSNILLLGERTDVYKLIAALDISTLSSSHGEAFPLSIVESMSGGVPCVVTDVGDSAWIVGNTGKVVNPRNPKAICDAWIELISIGEQARFQLGKAARERMKKRFSIETITDQYQELYKCLSTQSVFKKSFRF